MSLLYAIHDLTILFELAELTLLFCGPFSMISCVGFCRVALCDAHLCEPQVHTHLLRTPIAKGIYPYFISKREM